MAAVSYASPVSPMRVLRRFSAPATPYGPGHRGVDLAAPPGSPVRSAADGVVSFAGPVAGRGVVVVAHRDGVSTEYEPVNATVRTGQAIMRGQPIGFVSGLHAGCPGRCLHWGAKRDGTYLDPLTLLGPLGVIRLLPWHGGA